MPVASLTSEDANVESHGCSEPARPEADTTVRRPPRNGALMLNLAVIGALSGGLGMQDLLRPGRLGGGGTFFWIQVTFLAHHAIRGWCPPLPLFRRLGYWTEREICAERIALTERLQKIVSVSAERGTSEPFGGRDGSLAKRRGER
jgi:hypothetical protein